MLKRLFVGLCGFGLLAVPVGLYALMRSRGDTFGAQLADLDSFAFGLGFVKVYILCPLAGIWAIHRAFNRK